MKSLRQTIIEAKTTNEDTMSKSLADRIIRDIETNYDKNSKPLSIDDPVFVYDIKDKKLDIKNAVFYWNGSAATMKRDMHAVHILQYGAIVTTKQIEALPKKLHDKVISIRENIDAAFSGFMHKSDYIIIIEKSKPVVYLTVNKYYPTPDKQHVQKLQTVSNNLKFNIGGTYDTIEKTFNK